MHSMTTSKSYRIPMEKIKRFARISPWLISIFLSSAVGVRGNDPIVDVLSAQDRDTTYSKPQKSTGGEGKWIQMATESPDDLSVDEFVRKYVDTGTPVVLRRSEVEREVSIDWMKQNCDLEGEIFLYKATLGSPTLDWAGLDDADVDTESLGDYLDHRMLSSSNATKYYGFEYNTKCHCSDMLSKIPWYSYFSDDTLLLDTDFGEMVWPSLIVGPSGSTSALHTDQSFLPFHLTVISGQKIFRVISLSDWREHLTDGSDPIYSFGGDPKRPVDAFDDDVAEREILSRGANVFNTTLGPGDTVYIPTGALHGAINIGGDPVAAVSSNILNPAHSRQVLEEYCLKEGNEDVEENFFCLFLVVDPDLEMGVRSSSNEMNVGLVNDFWEHSLAYPGFCENHDNATECPHAAARCAARDDSSARKTHVDKIIVASGGVSKKITDMNDNGKTSYREFLLNMLMVYDSMKLIDLKNARNMDDVISIRSWLREATEEIWQLEGPAPNVRDLDEWYNRHLKKQLPEAYHSMYDNLDDSSDNDSLV